MFNEKYNIQISNKIIFNIFGHVKIVDDVTGGNNRKASPEFQRLLKMLSACIFDA